MRGDGLYGSSFEVVTSRLCCSVMVDRSEKSEGERKADGRKSRWSEAE